MRTVLFICSGNTCRSPMAEAMARHWLAQQPSQTYGDVFVASAGVAAAEGMPTSSGTVAALNRLGIDHEGRSKGLTADMIRKAHLVLCMTAEHVYAVRALIGDDPENIAKIHQLDPDQDMDDPIGLGQAAYDALARRLDVLIPQRLEELLSNENRTGIRSSGR